MDLTNKLMQCFVTYVSCDNSNIEIWAQTDAQTCNNVEKFIASNHHTLSDRFAAQFTNISIEVGKYYLTHMKNDLRFYRVVVTHIRDNSALVSYIDFGNEEWVPNENLIEMKEAFDLKPLAAKYFLADVTPLNKNVGWNVEEVKQLLDEFVYSLFQCEIVDTIENTELIRIYDENFGQPLFRKLVNNLIAIKTMSKMNLLNNMESSTTAVNGSAFDDSLPPENKNKKTKLDNIIPEVNNTKVIMSNCLNNGVTLKLIGSAKAVYIMETLSHSFYCQLVEKFDEIQSLLSNMTDFYDKLKNKSFELNVSTISNGLIVAAKFSGDQCWYRAEVIALHVNQVEVFYIDYGNKEKVDKNDCKLLDERFKLMPPQAIHCSLINKSISSENLKQLQEDFISINCEFIGSKNNVYNVNLLPNVNEFDKLNSIVKLSNKSEDIGDNAIKEKGDICVKVNFDSSPSREVISINNASKETFHIEVKLDSKQTNLISISMQSVNIGSNKLVYISAPNSVDSFYCQFVETYDQIESLLETMTSFYRNVSNDAFDLEKSKIVEGLIVAAKFTEDQSWYRAEVCSLDNNQVDVLYIDYGNKEKVDIKDCKILDETFKSLPRQAFHCTHVNQNLSLEYLKQLHFEITETNCEFIESKNNIYVVKLPQIAVESDKINSDVILANKSEVCVDNAKMDETLSYKDNKLESSKVNDTVFSDSVPVYQSLNGTACDGNELEVNGQNAEIIGVYDDNFDQSLVDNSVANKTIDSTIKNDLNNIESSAKVQNGSSSDGNVIEVNIQNTNDIKVNCLANGISINLIGLTKEVYILETFSDSFYCQLVEKEEETQALLTLMTEFYENLNNKSLDLNVSKIVEGLIVAAKFTEDQSWYRAEVCSLNNNQVNVFYIDYGNKEKVDINDCKLLDERFKSLPPQAIHCTQITENMSSEHLKQLHYGYIKTNCDFIGLTNNIYNVNLPQNCIESDVPVMSSHNKSKDSGDTTNIDETMRTSPSDNKMESNKDSDSVFSDSVYESLNDVIYKIEAKEAVEQMLIGFD